MAGIWQEFQEFIQRGNVVELAVGVVVGGAFGKITNSLVSDMVMPVVGLILGKTDFNNLFFALDGKIYPTLAEAKKAAAPVLAYGSFLNSVVEFLVVAFAVFWMVKAFNSVHRRAEALRAKLPLGQATADGNPPSA